MAISNLSNGLRTGVCTSTNRPTTPYEGQVIYETDTDKVFVWNASAWKQIPTAATAGAVLQVVQGTNSTQTITTSGTFVDTNLTATITPQYSTSKVLAMVTQNAYVDTAGTDSGFQLLRGANQIGLSTGVAYGTGSGNVAQWALNIFDSPATTSATIYKTQMKRISGAGQVISQVSSQISTIILIEISA